MQAVPPVDVRVENDLHKGSNIQNKTKTSTYRDRQAPRIRTHVMDRTKAKKTKSSIVPSRSNIPKQVIVPKLVSPIRSHSSSPNRGPWVPAPGRATKGQRFSWQSPEARLEINPVTEVSIDDEDDPSWNTEHDKHNVTINSQRNNSPVQTIENEKMMGEIQTYGKRIQGLIDGVAMLRELITKKADQEKTNQCRSELDSSLVELEQLQKDYIHRLSSSTLKPTRSRSLSPIRKSNRSLSADGKQPRRSTTSRVSFQDDPVNKRRRARSTTPINGPIYLNPEREQLLIKLADSEADVGRITKTLTAITDKLTRIKLDDKSVSLEVEQLCHDRNQLLHMIEQYERSNSKLKEHLQHQYHLEAEHGLIYDENNTPELRHENQQMKRLLADREKDNIALQSELERIKTQSMTYDTLKSSLEQNRAHLQRELYSKEGEVQRLQCALRALERDLQRSRCKCDRMHQSGKNKRKCSACTRFTSSVLTNKTKPMTTGKFDIELYDRNKSRNELTKNLYNNTNEEESDTNPEVTRLRTKLEESERLLHDYKAKVHTQTLQASATNSKNHLSEIELEKARNRLQKRIEELEPLPQLLKKAEAKNEKLQKHNNELERRLSQQITHRTHSPSTDGLKDYYVSPGDDNHSLRLKIISLEEQNDKLTKMLEAKEDELRALKKPSFSKSLCDFNQPSSRFDYDCTQSKRENDAYGRGSSSELNELRQKLEKSNAANRALQNYINQLRTAHSNLFNDALPSSITQITTK